MAKIRSALAALLFTTALCSTSHAGVTAVGASNTHRCMRLAFSGASDRTALTACNAALSDEVLTGPLRAGTLTNRGVIHLRRGAAAAALADFDAALVISPRSGEAYFNRGAVHVSEGRYAQGMADIDRGLALGMSQPEKAFYNRAIAREALDDLPGAYADYRRAARLKPGWDPPQRELARFTVQAR